MRAQNKLPKGSEPQSKDYTLNPQRNKLLKKKVKVNLLVRVE